jgi:gliding-associated putative ABC transporter substrate-binding component GldG
MKRKQLLTATMLTAGILLLVNLLAREYSLRLDFTADQRYTLSKVTKDILKDLKDPVTVTVYFSENLPPQLSKVRRDFEDMLSEYASHAEGNLVYEFINPGNDPATEQKAMKDGVSPIEISVREKDQLKKQKAYMGAIIHKGEQKEVIPVIAGQPIEYALSSNIKKLAVANKPKIAFLQGHGEPLMAQLAQLNQMLSILYQPKALFLSDTAKIADDIKTIAVVAPRDTFPASHIQQLEEFVAKGGNVVLALNKVDAPKQLNVPLTPIYTGLEPWLAKKGITLDNKVVIDVQCGQVSIPRRVGNMTLQSQERFFYFPLLNKFADHPAAKGLEAVLFQFANPLSFNGDTTKKFIPLAYTSERSGVLPASEPISLERNWQNSDFNQPRQVVAAALEGKLAGNKPSKLVVFGDGDFAVATQQGQQVNPDNVNFMANAIDWLSDDTGLIDLRTKQVKYRPIRQDLSESFKSFLKYFNFLFTILLVMISGLMRMQKRQAIRRQRMSKI